MADKEYALKLIKNMIAAQKILMEELKEEKESDIAPDIEFEKTTIKKAASQQELFKILSKK